MKNHKRFMQMSIDLALTAIDQKRGGPFGAVIVREERIIGASGNCVLHYTDPTAHAEMMAIRDACLTLKSTDLSGCIIYSSGEPCPMCAAAIYWANISQVYFCNTEKQSMEYGFVDKQILDQLKLPPQKRKIKSQHLLLPDGIKVFDRALTLHI